MLYKKGSVGLMLGLSLGVSTGVGAVENGGIITPPGIFDFGSGITPPPSEYGALGVRMVAVRANLARDDSGEQSHVKPDLAIHAMVFAFLKMTNIDFLGGKYGFGAVVPTMKMNLALDIPTPVGSITKSGSDRSVGDAQLLPVLVQWKPFSNFWANAGLIVQAPTGAYRKDNLINVGVNHWTVQPNFSFTYIASYGWELSGSSQLNINTRNHATQYRSGVEWQQDFGVGRHLGHFIVGGGGYFYSQLTDDQSSGGSIGNRSRVFAVGPAIGYVAPELKRPIVYVHAYKEFAARNRPEGYQVAMRVSWAL